MNSINIELINKQFCKKKSQPQQCNQPENNKMKIQDFFSINEINITDKIKKIKNYTIYYDVLNTHKIINIGKINESNEKILDIVTPKNNERYILLTYNDIKYLSFNDFLFNLPTPKIFILHILNSYENLLCSLIKLNENNICFFNLSPENIIFSPQTNTPLIRGFNKSICFENTIKLKDTILFIIKKIKNYTYIPLEVHILFYLIINNEETMTYSLINTICENYINNMNILDLFSQIYREKYKNTCLELLKEYINKPKTDIIDVILKYMYTWDNYSLSIIYLYIIGNVSKVFSLNEKIISNLLILLSKNIHPNPLKRESLQGTIDIYNKLFEKYTDWSFINSIPKEKIETLYKVLLN